MRQDVNAKKGLSTTVDNFKPLSMKTKHDGPQVGPHNPNYSGWVLKPGID